MAWFWNKGDNTKDLKAQYELELNQLSKKHNIAVNNILNMSMRGLLSGGYDNADRLHNVYNDFGYPLQLTFTNFWSMYRRFGIAKAVCDIPVNLTWLDQPIIEGGARFDSEFKALADRLKLFKRLKALDHRQRVGRFAGLYVRVKDGKKPNEELSSINANSIYSLTPLYDGQLHIEKSDQDPTSETYAQPIIYRYDPSASGNRNKDDNQSIYIHASRIITAAEGADDGTIYGISALEAVFNDLLDLRKIAGAGGEGFYQNSRHAPVINLDPEFGTIDAKTKESIEQEVDQFQAGWRKKFISAGLEFNYNKVSLDNPKPHYDNSLNNVAAGSGIPAKVLIGQQTGKLASDEDGRQLLVNMNSRRENFATELVESFIDWCVKYNALPSPSNLIIEWTDLLARSDEDKLELAEKMASVNEKQFRAGLAPVFSEEQIAEAAGYEIDADLPTLEDMDDNLDNE